MVKSLPAMWEAQVQSLSREDPLEKEMATDSSILAWKTPQTEEPGRLQSIALQTVGDDWTTSLSLSLYYGFHRLGTDFYFSWTSAYTWHTEPLYKVGQCLLMTYTFSSAQLSSVQSCPTLRLSESQSTRPPCPSPTPEVYSNSCPSSRWCHPAISSSAVPFSSCPQSLPASGSFPMSQLSPSGGQSTGVSALASVLPVNTQDWSPLGWTGWISL